MMTEEQLQKYEKLVHAYNRQGDEAVAHIIAHLCQEVRALQEKAKAGREPEKTES